MTAKKTTRTFIDGKPTPVAEVGFGKIVRAFIRTETLTDYTGTPITSTYLQTQVKTDNGWRDLPGNCGGHLSAMIMEMLTANA